MNGYSRRASKEKQTFALDLLISQYIPRIQMTFPTVTLPSSPDRPSQHKKNTCWGPWNARIHQSL